MKSLIFSALLLLWTRAHGLSPDALLARQSIMDALRDGVPEGRYTCAGSSARRIGEACEALEQAAPEAVPGFPRDLMLVDGVWRLAYSSNVLQGGGPLLRLLPDTLSTPLLDLADSSPFSPSGISQTIDVMERTVINSVTLSPWPGGVIGDVLSGGLPVVGGVLGKLKGASVSLELDHSFKVDGDGADGGPKQWAASSEINMQLRSVRRSLSGMESDDDMRESGALDDVVSMVSGFIPAETAYDVPQLLRDLPDVTKAGVFATTYVDESMRIARGASAGQELRIFVRDVIEDSSDASEESTQGTFQGDESIEGSLNMRKADFEDEMDFIPSD